MTYRTDDRLPSRSRRRPKDSGSVPRFDPSVVVSSESEPYVRNGRNAFAKFVTTVDARLRLGDQTLLIDGDKTLFAVGTPSVPAKSRSRFALASR